MKLKLVNRVVLDRIVNGKAVLIDSSRKQTVVPLKSLPQGIEEGDILIGGKISRREIASTKLRVKNLVDQIFGMKKPPRGG